MWIWKTKLCSEKTFSKNRFNFLNSLQITGSLAWMTVRSDKNAPNSNILKSRKSVKNAKSVFRIPKTVFVSFKFKIWLWTSMLPIRKEKLFGLRKWTMKRIRIYSYRQWKLPQRHKIKSKGNTSGPYTSQCRFLLLI